ncbi:MAG: M28 family peptidase, partial [Ilumatobacteraceae bacterium]
MSSTYYSGRYWNDLVSVRRHLAIRATGEPGVTWYEWLGRDGRTFDRVLMLNCGNGWVERALHDARLIGSVVGVDIDAGFIEGARLAAEWIADAFAEAGLTPAGGDDGWFDVWEEEGPDGPLTLRNVLGVLPGTDPSLAARPVVVGAHYDHLGTGWPEVRQGNEGRIHPGADDNAS